MKCKIERGVSAIGVKALFASITGLDNSAASEEWKKERGERLDILRGQYEGYDYHSDPYFEGFHILHDKAGVRRRKNVPSGENLLKMLVKHQDMVFINNVVDIYNVISMERRLSAGAHDMDRIDGDLTLRFTDGSETYIPLGSPEPVPVRPHEYCYCDDSNEVLCRLEIKQVEKTKIGEDVRNVLYILEGHEATEDAYLREVMQEIIDTTVKYCGGEGTIIEGEPV